MKNIHMWDYEARKILSLHTFCLKEKSIIC